LIAQKNEVNGEKKPISNFRVLAITTLLFGAFVIAEIIGAMVCKL